VWTRIDASFQFAAATSRRISRLRNTLVSTRDTGVIVKTKSVPAVPASRLVEFLADGRARSISELAAHTGLSRSTVKQRTDELMAIGLVQPTGTAVSTGGRPSAMLRLQAEAWPVLAIDLGASHLRVGICDLFGKLLADTRAEIDIAQGPKTVIGIVAETAKALLRRTGIPLNRISAVGMGLPGPVEHSSGRPIDPPIMPGWHNVDVRAMMGKHFSAPVLIENDANIAALGEQAYGWPTVQNLIYVKVSTGIGAGIIANGELQRGAQGTAGDIGHVHVSSDGNLVCRCGKIGCLEAFASGSAVLRDLNKRGRQVSSIAEIAALADRGDAEVTALLRDCGRAIGEVLVTCVSLLNPSVITVGGSLGELGDHILASVREIVYSRSPTLTTRDLTIARTRAGEKAALIGAGALAVNYVLSHDYIQARIEASGIE